MTALRSSIFGLSIVLAGATAGPAFAQTIPVPPIYGAPTLDTPLNLLDWEYEFPKEAANLDEPTANRLNDLHGELSQCDLALSTAGNYHMALKDLMQYYLHVAAADLGITSWTYTTSPPISYASVKHSVVQFGNLAVRCRPQLAVAPAGEFTDLRREDFIAGDLVAVIRNYGNVILVKKGNPKRIDSVWDLGRPDIRIVTPNPDPQSEPGSFGNYSGSIYRIAYYQYFEAPAVGEPTFCEANPNECQGMTPQELFDRIFNGAKPSPADKWLAGKRIHHREVPWSIAYGRADAGLIFYHLARHAVEMFPDTFEIVPLGGTAYAPAPLKGNNQAVLSMGCIKDPAFTPLQIAARDRLAEAYMSTTFDTILADHGLTRPANFETTRAKFVACQSQP